MMSLREARSLLAVCLLFTAPVDLARSEETFVWTEKASAGMVSLTYGPVDTSKQPVFLLSCFNEMGIAALDIFGAIQGARPGDKLAIELSAGSAHTLDGEVVLDDKGSGMYAEASGFDVKPVLAVLKAPGQVNVTMAETKLTLSDTGRADAAEQFSKHCELD